jgi:hypothetical protein
MGKKVGEKEYNKIKITIIRKLYSKQAFKKGHLLFEGLQSGIEPHLKGFVKDVLINLIKQDLIIHYGKTEYGDAYQLNINKLKEIEEIIGIK